MADRLVYGFGRNGADGGREDKPLLGGKGANLGEMTRIGVPVPPGFTITTAVCRHYLRDGAYPQGLRGEVEAGLRRLERETGKRFGGEEAPLLVSVRSGAAVSMPGMMDTILNLGLNDRTVEALAASAGDERFAYDSYRRFVQMYGEVVLGIAAKRFARALESRKEAEGARHDTELTAAALRSLVEEYEAIVMAETGTSFPQDPEAQLWGAIGAVFDSWNTKRASHYRQVNRIPNDLGTAVNVVAMVYGNMGDDSGTGVAFTRNPSTGERAIFGEFLLNAQGEDVVAGIRDPLSIAEMEAALPDAYRQLVEVAETLEHHYRDAQDMEFTVERGTLYLLQTRTAKRTAMAALRCATEMVAEGLIDEDAALRRMDASQLDQLLHPRVDPAAVVAVVARGLPASPGAESGRVVFTAADAVAWAERGEAVVLLRAETSPDDFEGMVAARAIVTARGGMTSHAAVVARGMGKCCVAGARELRIDEAGRRVRAGEHTISEGDWVTVDGSNGRLLLGRVPTLEGQVSGEFERLMSWADERRRMEVRANADTAADAARAREFGAEGIGLCRTEHMFFEGERIDAVRDMILAQDADRRRHALDKLLPMQREDFAGIFRAMDGLPVTVRLLDPPLHEFLPKGPEEIAALAERLDVEPGALERRVSQLREDNPMLGHRGVRVGLSHPEITEMQVRALFQAAVAVKREGVDVRPEVMVPLVGMAAEFDRQEALIRRTAESVLVEAGVDIPYLVGTMIELPRAALTAADIARCAEFFSFGTNDLTQTTLGLSRDDAGSFLPEYIEQGILPDDPFQTIDRSGVGRLVHIATGEGRASRPELKVGVCGEHGGDPRSVAFFEEVGLDYVSCSPFRVPVARLAAAQAALAAEPALRPASEQAARPDDVRDAAGDGARAAEPEAGAAAGNGAANGAGDGARDGAGNGARDGAANGARDGAGEPEREPVAPLETSTEREALVGLGASSSK